MDYTSQKHPAIHWWPSIRVMWKRDAAWTIHDSRWHDEAKRRKLSLILAEWRLEQKGEYMQYN